MRVPAAINPSEEAIPDDDFGIDRSCHNAGLCGVARLCWLRPALPARARRNPLHGVSRLDSPESSRFEDASCFWKDLNIVVHEPTSPAAIDAEPTAEELAAIERESPLIDAEMRLLDAEILLILAEPEPTALDWHRMRRAEALVMRELVKLRRTPPASAAQAA